MVKKDILLKFLEEEVTPVVKKHLDTTIKEGNIILYPTIRENVDKELDKIGILPDEKGKKYVKEWVNNKTRELLTPQNVKKNLRR
tara:strand:+ start:5160 stop:5414 length:255 start_codon:yes stop_codon:yes gene_type:complete